MNGLKRDLNLSSFHALGKVLYCKRGNGEAEEALRDDVATDSQRQYVLALSIPFMTFALDLQNSHLILCLVMWQPV